VATWDVHIEHHGEETLAVLQIDEQDALVELHDQLLIKGQLIVSHSATLTTGSNITFVATVQSDSLRIPMTILAVAGGQAILKCLPIPPRVRSQMDRLARKLDVPVPASPPRPVEGPGLARASGPVNPSSGSHIRKRRNLSGSRPRRSRAVQPPAAISSQNTFPVARPRPTGDDKPDATPPQPTGDDKPGATEPADPHRDDPGEEAAAPSVASAPPSAAAAPPPVTTPRTPAAEAGQMQRLPHDETRATLLAQASTSQPLFKGSLTERSVGAWILMAAGRKEHGVWTVQTDGVTFHALASLGEPLDVQVMPNTGLFSLAVMIGHRGLLDVDVIGAADAHAKHYDIDVGDMLIRDETMTEEQVTTLRGQRLKFLLMKMLQATSGAFFYNPSKIVPFQVPVPSYHLPKLVFEGTVKRHQQRTHADLSACRERLANHYPIRVEPALLSDEDLQLGSKDQRFVETCLDQGRRLWEIQTISNLNKTHTTVLLLTLEDLGVITFVEDIDKSYHDAQLIERFRSRAANIQRETDFELVGCHWSAYGDMIEAGYQKAVDGLADHQFKPDQLVEIRDHLAVIRAEVKAGYQRLQQPKGRKACRLEITDELMLMNSVDLFLKQADMALMRDDADRAKDYYLRVLELEPRNAIARKRLKKK
jgi:hypothetical protein